MQEIVTVVNNAADATGEFGRIESELVQSAKDNHYPLHYAWERTADFSTAYRGGGKDVQASAQFAIVGKAKNHTFAEIEDLFEKVVREARDQAPVEPEDFDSFDANFGGTRVRIALYSMTLDTTRNF